MIKKIYHTVYRALPFKKAVWGLLRNVWVPPLSIRKHLRVAGEFTIPLSDRKMKIVSDYDTFIENEIFWKGGLLAWEPASIGAWLHLAKQASVIIDVGANTGLYAVSAALVNPSARTIAVEPIAGNLERMERLCQANNLKLEVWPLALSDKPGEAVMYIEPNTTNYVASVGKNLSPAGRPVQEVRVPLARLDDKLANLPASTRLLLKVDVETHEPEVVAGMGRLIADLRPAMILEVLNLQVFEQLWQLLAPAGYQVYCLADEQLKTADPAKIDRFHCNYLFLPNDGSWSLQS